MDIEHLTFDGNLETCLFDIVGVLLESIPSEKHAELEDMDVAVDGLCEGITGDLNRDRCALLNRRRGMILIDVDRE